MTGDAHLEAAALDDALDVVGDIVDRVRKRAGAALEPTFADESGEEIDVPVEAQISTPVLVAAKTPITEPGSDHAVAAGDASVQVTAANVAG